MNRIVETANVCEIGKLARRQLNPRRRRLLPISIRPQQ
jgi:hypothetical protein